jgi:host factor-I protein
MQTARPLRKRTKNTPSGDTGQEALALRALSEKQQHVVVKLRGGDVFEGWIEYFDSRMIRLTRSGEPNLFLYKEQVLTIRESDKRQLKKPENNI